MNIVGAGLSGLLGGALDRRAHLFEVQPRLPHNHHAVLRFRENKIGRALHIPFRQVRVLKSITMDGRHDVRLTPQIANFYAKKVTGRFVDRSVMKLDPADRWIAPPNLPAQLAELCHGRIEYGAELSANNLVEISPLISTIPLPTMLGIVGIECNLPLLYAGIQVSKYRVAGADLYQTIYFPAPDVSTYRATMTGELLTIERSGNAPMMEQEYLAILDAFGFHTIDCEMLEGGKQKFGKILPLPDLERKALLFQLTERFSIYSLGRFATWRNVLLDDVYEDFHVIQRLAQLTSYDLQRSIIK